MLLIGDCFEKVKEIEESSVQAIVTSPPYWGLRDYDNDDIEEERRLFYVAITRSRKEVVLSYAKTRRRFGAAANLTVKSRFLKEIPLHLIQTNINYNIEERLNANKYVSDDCNSINVNSIVEHNVFGKGKVLNIEGAGGSAKLTILFINNVTKKLIFKYANLKKLSKRKYNEKKFCK